MSYRIPNTNWLTAFLVLSHFGCTADPPEGRRAASEAVAESDPLSHVFTYSILETDPTRGAVLESLEALAIPTLVEAGATPYSVWLPVGISDPDRFRGEALSETQLVLMLAWPQQDVQISRLDSTLRALDGVTAVTSRTFVPIYLTEGLTVPTGAGFYVHREQLYREGDLAEVERTSRELREAMEPFFGVRVIGDYRESPDSADVARLTRIVWYPSFEVWIESRDFSGLPEASRAAGERGQLELRQLERSGAAIATDRAVRYER